MASIVAGLHRTGSASQFKHQGLGLSPLTHRAPTSHSARRRWYLREHLPSALAARLDVNNGQVATKLATGNDVYATFDEMVVLYSLVRDGPFRCRPGHEYNTTPDDLLQTRTCLYLGAWEDRGTPKPRVLIAGDALDDLKHLHVWRKTKRTLSRNGNCYHRKIPPMKRQGASATRTATACRVPTTPTSRSAHSKPASPGTRRPTEGERSTGARRAACSSTSANTTRPNTRRSTTS